MESELDLAGRLPEGACDRITAVVLFVRASSARVSRGSGSIAEVPQPLEHHACLRRRGDANGSI